MEIGANQSEQIVAVAPGEQRDFQFAVGVGKVGDFEGLHIALAGQSENMRIETAFVEQMDPLRRDIAASRIGRVRLVDRDGVGENRDRIEQRDHEQADESELVTLEAQPCQP